ncbi:MAG: hypothetical protein JNJ49_12775 [Bdellovibrionaceae bacterium]|nr:hypothetical protein [Pseudobdellovibrionaceae bacterium]
MNKTEKELRFLKIYSGVLTACCALLFVFLFKSNGTRRFEEIDVERINIVEADGRLRMVISNQKRQHPGSMDGVTYEERIGKRPPGMMFFNEKGDEVGGLVFDGSTGKGQGGSLTFDKFRGDQTIQFIHDEEPNESYFAGMKMNDQNMPLNELVERQREISKLPTKVAQDQAWRSLREEGRLMTERLRIGKDYDKSAIIKMKDATGKVRIELKVEAGGHPKMSFLDESGKVIYKLPPAGANKAAL